ncbi:MAG: hypothetical protein JNJ59_11415 [Deltaproteobacteria bacterium]|nr:hypothetical protein [Deltaproteobacteria bacterium]
MHRLFLAVLVGLLAACVDDGLSSLVVATDEPVGANCPYGGVRFDVGQDRDGDGRLDSGEVTGTSYACNQRVDGRSIAVRVTPIGASADCPAGGIEVATGLDDDDDRTLDDDEVDQTRFVCNGRDGLNTLVRLVPIAADVLNPLCPLGGTRIESGRDRNRNGELESDEVEAFQSVCSIRVNDDLMLIDQAVELPGDNCPNGGTRVRFGLDDDGDRVLDPEELMGTPVYMCNTQTLIAGKTALVRIEDASLAQCTFGGFVMHFGLDDDYDGSLDEGERDGFRLVCNGRDGYDGLVAQIPITGGDCGIDLPGVRVESGLDLDRDGVLDPNEVTARSVVCDGLDGLPGPAALIVQSNDVRFCEGGIVLFSGTDWDLDGFLDPDEIDDETEVCDGIDGHNALVEVYDGDALCAPDVGVLIRTGTDWNDNQRLDPGEFDEAVLCGLP